MAGGAERGRPLCEADCDRLFANLASLRSLGLAVSGGPDSTALALLADDWSKRRGGPELTILTVDHGLRPSSAIEAAAVMSLASRLGRPAETLIWHHDGTPPTTAVEETARIARYRLLAEAARRRDLDAVALAHTLDDQAETFLMRLARGSGVRGLSAMATERTVDGVRFVRPLLTVSKADLLALLEARDEPYAIDASNASDRFLRARVRKLMPVFAGLGLTADRLRNTAADRMARAEAALRHVALDLQSRAVRDLGGAFLLDANALAAADDEIVLRLLVATITRIRPRIYPPRASAPERWLAAFRRGTAPLRATMAGVTFWRRRGGIWVYAEAGRAGFPRLEITADGAYVWDDRFAVDVSCLGNGSAIVAAASGAAMRADLPKTVAASLPTVYVSSRAARVALAPLGPYDDAKEDFVFRRLDGAAAWQALGDDLF